MLISNKRYFCVCFFVTWRGCRWPGRPPVGGAAGEKEGGGGDAIELVLLLGSNSRR